MDEQTNAPVQLFVREADGATTAVMLYLDNTVAELKEHLALPTVVGVPEELQRLVFNGADLDDGDLTLEEFGVGAGATIGLVETGTRVRAGAARNRSR